MPNDHWFDALNKLLVREVPRRTMLGTAASVVAKLALARGPLTEAANRRRKRKGRKRKGDRKSPPSCSDGACAAEPAWVGNETEIAFCETKCERCREAGTPFCIHDPDDEHPVVHATCCPRGDECCGRECCGPPNTCCHDAPGGPICVQGIVDCCPDDVHFGWCSPETEICCPGVGCVVGTSCSGTNCPNCRGPGRVCCAGACVNTLTDPDHCGGCIAPPCTGEGMRCCDGSCVDIRTDLNHCGACGRDLCIPFGWQCCQGECTDQRSDPEHCGGCDQPCIGPGLACCDSGCRDTRTDQDHCGRCSRRAPGHLCCNSVLYDADTAFCCPDGLRPCNNNQICCTRPDGVPACCVPP